MFLYIWKTLSRLNT